jgi:hypothetical protein
MNWTKLVLLSLFCFVGLGAPKLYAQGRGGVAVIAHSISTSSEARRVLRKMGWSETSNLRYASAILVVCRSGLMFPLNSNYDSFKDLDRAADSQMNISGDEFHVYIYRFNSDLSVSESQHIHYKAD